VVAGVIEDGNLPDGLLVGDVPDVQLVAGELRIQDPGTV
jgi:hypothetical protein